MQEECIHKWVCLYRRPYSDRVCVKCKIEITYEDFLRLEHKNGGRVFLGGTCNGSNWREEFIPLLSCDYFNPVVDDWTRECVDEENRQKSICTTLLYVITPKMNGFYSIAELVDDSNKRPYKTIMVIIEDDASVKLSFPKWKSIKEVGNLVSKNGVPVFYSLKDAANEINRRLNNND